MDSHDGQYRLASRDDDPNPTVIFGDATEGVWENLILQKSGGDGFLFFNGVAVGNIGDNPGGLQNFRLGINRNNDNSFLGFIDNVQIWDDADQDPAAIFAAGSGINQVAIPEPTSIAIWSLLGLSLAGFGYFRFNREKWRLFISREITPAQLPLVAWGSAGALKCLTIPWARSGSHRLKAQQPHRPKHV